MVDYGPFQAELRAIIERRDEKALLQLLDPDEASTLVRPSRAYLVASHQASMTQIDICSRMEGTAQAQQNKLWNYCLPGLHRGATWTAARVGDAAMLQYMLSLSPIGSPRPGVAQYAVNHGQARIICCLLAQGISVAGASLGGLPRPEQSKLWWCLQRLCPTVVDLLPERYRQRLVRGDAIRPALGQVLPADLVQYLIRVF